MNINKELINNYRKQNNLTVSEFCEKCNLSMSSYYKIMNSNSNTKVSKTLLFKVARFMNIHLSQMFID